MVEADVGMMRGLAQSGRQCARCHAQRRTGSACAFPSWCNEAHSNTIPKRASGASSASSKTDPAAGFRRKSSSIFEAFFHTKEVGKGNRPRPGDGLWHCQTAPGLDRGGKRRRQRHDVSHLHSLCGFGTHRGRKTDNADHHSWRQGTVLLVEDEKPVRELVSRVLQKIRLQNFYRRAMASKPSSFGISTGTKSPCCSPTW